jgi:hypothetical protein
MKIGRQLGLLVLTSAVLALGGCDDAEEFNAAQDSNCESNEYLAEDGSCQERTFGVEEKAEYSYYRPGGSAAFEVSGKAVEDLTVTLNGSEISAVPVGNRAFVSIPGDASGDVDLLFADEEGASVGFQRQVDDSALIAGSEASAVVQEQRNVTDRLLAGTEQKVEELQTNQPEGLLEATESVDSGLDERIGLLDSTETEVTANGLNTVVPVMLESQEDPVEEGSEQEDILLAVDRLRKQTNDTCGGVIDDLNRINDVLSYEAGSLLAIATPLIDNEPTSAEILVGVGWTYWIDDMLAFLSGVEQFAQACATASYDVSLAGSPVDSEPVVVRSNQSVALSVDVTREFTDEAADVAKSQLKPLIDTVMTTTGNFYDNINVNVEYLDQQEFTGPLAAGAIGVSTPDESPVSVEPVVEGDSLSVIFTLDQGAEATTETVTVTDTIRGDTVTFDVTVEPALEVIQP